MNFFDTLGAIGALLFFLKMGIHIYINRTLDKKFPLGALGQYTNPIFFLPIMDDLTGKLYIMKKIGNIIYVGAVLMILIFLIANWVK